MLRQPDVCLCFGGRCWKQHCPNRKKPFEDPYDKPKVTREKRRQSSASSKYPEILVMYGYRARMLAKEGKTDE